MRTSKLSKRFRKDYERLAKSGRRNIDKLEELMFKLIKDEELSPRNKDHALQGELKGYRDCHIEGDWVLIYELSFDEEGNETITFHATDKHSNLFG